MYSTGDLFTVSTSLIHDPQHSTRNSQLTSFFYLLGSGIQKKKLESECDLLILKNYDVVGVTLTPKGN